ncbi:hypothetical protein [Luteimonas aquatica]|uniref:hypothetical protein n=1 Tax=Luteimonas aquatica TaxID=450364 RepID=UPI001F5756C4|nr:hypothetical protein [Luteimonas aquatica]
MAAPVARTVSILGHPLLLLSLALLATQAGRGSAAQGWQLALGLGAAAALVMGYSWWQVRRKRWGHVDASHRDERARLNRFLLVVLGAGAAVAWWAGAPRGVPIALALSAAMILAALLAAPWCKLSLHLAFAVFAACLLAPLSGWATLAGLAFAACIAWSRLALSRHVPRDLVAGTAAGAAAGACFLLLTCAGSA